MRNTMWSARTLVAGAGIGAIACGGGGGGGGTASTRDSAGVTIVESTGPVWTPEQVWKVVDSVIVDIGDVDRVIGPVRLTDGRLAIANGGTNEVRVYDAKGARLRASGRTGSGPGEYQNLGGIWAGPGDSVMVSDVIVRRLSVLDDTAGFARSLSLGGAGGLMVPTNGKIDFATPIGWFGDGSIVGVSLTFAMNQRREGNYRDTMTVIRYGPDGAVRDTVGRFPGVETETMTLSFGGRQIPVPTAVPLGKQTVTLARGNRFFVSTNDAWQIEVLSLDGTVRQIIRSVVRVATITPAEVAEHKKILLAQFEGVPQMRSAPAEIRKQLTDRVNQAKYPAVYTYFAAFLADEDGNLWAQEVTPPSDKSQRFAVVDTSGKFLGRVTMPPNFQPSHIGRDVVYGVWKDPDEVEHVRGYPLRKPVAPAR